LPVVQLRRPPQDAFHDTLQDALRSRSVGNAA
jgi:hypothetical protein